MSKSGYYNARLEIDFVASTDITYVSRVVYALFMLISDVGGLSGFLVSLTAIIVGVFTYKNT